jgi:formylglycine-generating enzyme required for sulfatase activity
MEAAPRTEQLREPRQTLGKRNTAMGSTLTRLTFLALLCLPSAVSGDLVFDWATVGNPGNAGEVQPEGTFGAVNYTYRISKHEVTNDQYAEFLNKVAATDANGLFHSSMDITRSGPSGSVTYSATAGFGPNPVNYLSFYNGMRFVNWLENGQPTGAQGVGTTEAGVYTIDTGLNETRAANATYFIPSEDEWYKAAYYDPTLGFGPGGPGGGYWDYPTQNDIAPIPQAPPGGANSANVEGAVGDTTEVGAYPGSTSFYGLFDQAGNVFEWNEAVVGGDRRGVRGGAFDPEASMFGYGRDNTGSTFREIASPFVAAAELGFRVASVVPEPGALILMSIGAVGLLVRRKRKNANETSRLHRKNHRNRKF